MTTQEERVVQLLEDLLGKLELHGAEPSHRSFGELKHLMGVVKDALEKKRYRDPLFVLNTPRWLGEWGNTPLEDEIFAISCQIHLLSTEICGGMDKVNAIRREHNEIKAR